MKNKVMAIGCILMALLALLCRCSLDPESRLNRAIDRYLEHKPDAIQALEKEFQYRRLIFLMGIMKDKDVRGTLQPLLGSATHLVLTRPHTDRALTPESLADAAHFAEWRGTVEIEREPGLALEAAWRHAPAICAAGSIFLVGDVLARLRPDT